MSLQRLTTPTGHVVVRDADPLIGIARDVTYIPYRPGLDASWGVFDRHRRHVPGSFDTREDPAVPCYQGAAWPSDVAEAARAAPFDRYIYFGNFALHYGHFLVNTLPRFWPLASDREPCPPILCHGPGTREDWAAFKAQVEILRRLGLTVHDIHTFEEPVRIRELVVPASSLQEQQFVHSVYGRLCDRIAQGIYEPGCVGSEARPVYLAKTRLKSGVRRFLNEEQVVDRLARGGVDIVYPEELDFAAQVRLFASRRTIIGSLGSALHTAVFAPPGRRIIVLCPTPEFSATYALTDALRQHQVHYYYPVGTSFEAFQSSFNLDFTLRDPEQVAEAILRRLDYDGDLEQYDYAFEPLNWHLSPAIPPLPRAPRSVGVAAWWRRLVPDRRRARGS